MMSLDNYGVVEMDADVLHTINCGGNPIVRKAVQFVAEQVADWAIGEMCSAAWDAFKASNHSMSDGQRSMNHAHQ